MRLAFTLVVCLLAYVPAAAPASPAAGDRLAAIAWLVGDWRGFGQGGPGLSGSSRQAERIQNGRFIRVEGRSVYPRQEGNRSGEIHSSLDLWSFDRHRDLFVLRQFDSLGFVSTYVQDRAASTGGRLVLVSEHLENVPAGWRARYTYEHPAPDEYRELFELDRGQGYQRYVSSRFLRVDGDNRQ
jgi:hypothetical protein